MSDSTHASTTESKAKVFISYSRKDMAFADRLDAALKARGFEVLIDRTEIYAFEDWWQRIEALIGRADTIVFVLSPDAVLSDVALKEVAYGATQNKRFAPIVARPVEDGTAPETLRRLNFIFFDDPDRFEISADRLAEALRTDIVWIRQHTEYGEIARHWVAARRPGGLLLRSPSLEEAERWIATRPPDAPVPTDETQAFVAESRRGANRRRNILTGSLAAGLVVALLLAGLAYWQRGIAVEERRVADDQRRQTEQEKQRADRNFTTAKQTVDALIFNIAQGLQNVAGMRVDTIKKILNTVQKTIDQLTQAAPDDPRLLRSRAAMFNNFVDTYLAAGDLRDAATAAAQGLDILRKLAAQNPGNAEAQRDVSVSLEKVGNTRQQQGDLAAALGAYQESLDIRRKLAAQNPDSPQPQRDVSVGLNHLGNVKQQQGDLAAALDAYQESLDIRRKLAAQDTDDAQPQRDVSVSLDDLGDVKLRRGDLSGAAAAYQESLNIYRRLAALDPGDAQLQRDVSLSLQELGEVKLGQGDLTGARASYQESLDIARKLAALDPDKALAQRDVSVSLSKLGDAKSLQGDMAGALAAYQGCLDIDRKLAAQDPDNAEAGADVSHSLEKLGDIKLRQSDLAGARAAFQESLDIRRGLAAHDSGDAEARRDVSVSLDRVGDVELRQGDRAAALAAYQASLDIRRGLAAQDQNDMQAQIDLVVSLYEVSTVADPAQAKARLIEALSIVEKLDQQHALTAEQKSWAAVFRTALGKLK